MTRAVCISALPLPLRPPKCGAVPPRIFFRARVSQGSASADRRSCQCSQKKPLTARASVGGINFVTEPATNVKFPTELRVPGCSKPLVLLGTGYREKVFAIIGVKVYAAAFYVENTIRENLNAWKGQSAADLLNASSLSNSMFEAPLEKSLNIMLVRDVDGKTFWNALDDVITARIKALTPEDKSALSTLRNTFLGHDLKQGKCIYLTWVEPSRMLISISSDGLPSQADTEIKSVNVSSALYDGFFGNAPVSPSLKASVADGLQKILN